MNDFTVTSLAPLLAARKNQAYRENIRLYFYHLVQFLQSHGLTTRTLLEPGQSVPDDAKLMRSDLTVEGYSVVQKGLSKWQQGLVAGTVRPVDTTILKKALDKVREIE